MAILEKSNNHSTKRKYFHIRGFYKDLQMKRPCFSFSIHELIPYLIPYSSQENNEVFLQSLIFLSIQEAVIILTKRKMKHKLHMVSLSDMDWSDLWLHFQATWLGWWFLFLAGLPPSHPYPFISFHDWLHIYLCSWSLRAWLIFVVLLN